MTPSQGSFSPLGDRFPRCPWSPHWALVGPAPHGLGKTRTPSKPLSAMFTGMVVKSIFMYIWSPSPDLFYWKVIPGCPWSFLGCFLVPSVYLPSLKLSWGPEHRR